jgi:hypothetical protein
MFGINKERADLRNHAVDAFLIGHLDGRVLRPAFDRLKDGYHGRLEEIYAERALMAVLDGIRSGSGFFDELKQNVERLDRELPNIATAHRADNRWNPGDAPGGSFGVFGGLNIYTFRPTLADRKALTAIAAKAGKAPEDGSAMTRKALLELLLSEPADDKERKMLAALRKQAETYYRQEGAEKKTTLKVQTALPLFDQPGAFIDAESKFAIVGAAKASDRRVVSVVEFSQMKAEQREALYANGQSVFRRGDTVVKADNAFVVTGLQGDGRLIAYPLDVAEREKALKNFITTGPDVSRCTSDVLGRRLYRSRKGSRGLKPVPYPLRDK